MDIVKNILKIAKENSYSDKMLCELLKKNTSYISDWKNGKSKPKADEVVILAKEFNVSVDYLVGNETQAVKLCPTVPTLSKDEQYIIDVFRSLNRQGQAFILENIDNANDIPRYKKDNSAAAPQIS